MMQQIFADNGWIFIVIILWTLPWKGVALWKAARLNHKVWFVILFLVSTVGILEILYIFIFSKSRTKKELQVA